MKEKIEEILLHLDSYFEQAMGTEVTREDWVNLRKELSDLISTLIQEERKEAVEGFIDWFETSDEASEFRAVEGIASANLSGGLKEYLESEK